MTEYALLPVSELHPQRNYWFYYNYLLKADVEAYFKPHFRFIIHKPKDFSPVIFAKECGISRSLVHQELKIFGDPIFVESYGQFLPSIHWKELKRIVDYIATLYTTTKRRNAAMKFFVYMYSRTLSYPAFSEGVEIMSKKLHMNRNDIAEYLNLFINKKWFVIERHEDRLNHITRAYKVNAEIIPFFLQKDDKFVWEHATFIK